MNGPVVPLLWLQLIQDFSVWSILGMQKCINPLLVGTKAEVEEENKGIMVGSEIPSHHKIGS